MSTTKDAKENPNTAMLRFLGLVEKISQGVTARSENDLSSNLAAVLSSFGLHAVVDSSVAASGRKRPDILGYISSDDADLVLPADVVIEAKKPQELVAFKSMEDAIVSELLWADKTLSYIRSNIVRIQYFILTTFTEFGVVKNKPFAPFALHWTFKGCQ
jgi:hypothetical protein